MRIDGTTPPAAGTDDVKLRKVAHQLEGVFTQQLFKAMRATVPENQGVVGDTGGAQDMFTGLLDEHLANDPRASSAHGIGDAIYHELLRSRGTRPAAAVTPPASGASLPRTS